VGIGQVSSGGERLPTQRRLTIETLYLTVPASLLVRADELIEMTTLFDALHESAHGTSRPFISVERLDPSDRFVLGHF
jgi:hypothetical protein